MASWELLREVPGRTHSTCTHVSQNMASLQRPCIQHVSVISRHHLLINNWGRFERKSSYALTQTSILGCVHHPGVWATPVPVHGSMLRATAHLAWPAAPHHLAAAHTQASVLVCSSSGMRTLTCSSSTCKLPGAGVAASKSQGPRCDPREWLHLSY